VRAALVARGYTFANQGFNGDIQAIVVGASGAVAVADPRGRGVARVLVGASARPGAPLVSRTSSRTYPSRTGHRKDPPAVPYP
jgi:hypothetical protein